MRGGRARRLFAVEAGRAVKMTLPDRALWLVGVAVLVVGAIYWQTIVTVYKNRTTIAKAATVADAYSTAMESP